MAQQFKRLYDWATRIQGAQNDIDPLDLHGSPKLTRVQTVWSTEI